MFSPFHCVFQERLYLFVIFVPGAFERRVAILTGTIEVGTMLNENSRNPHVAKLSGNVKRRVVIAFIRVDIDFGTVLNKNACNTFVPPPCGSVKCGTFLRTEIDFGTAIYKSAHHVFVTIPRSEIKWCARPRIRQIQIYGFVFI